MRKPYQRKELRLYSVGGGVGDELMCGPILQEIKRQNPDCRLTFLARHPELFEGNPSIDRLVPVETTEGEPGHGLGYNHCTPPVRPLMTHMAECVGFSIRPTHVVSPAVAAVSPEFRRRVDAIPRPLIVVQPRAGRWTPNKQWPEERWEELIRRLVGRVSVLEVGIEPLGCMTPSAEGFWSFAGTTGLAEFAYIIGSADLFVGPPSGGMHLANAMRAPTVVLFGGYESPEGYDYPWVASHYSPVECAPCWKTNVCPIDLKCLRAILVDEVCDTILAGIDWKVVPGARKEGMPDGATPGPRHVPGRVSVVIPAYNRAHMIMEAIDSVKAQTYPDVQLIVVDDGSTDGTADLVERMGGMVCIRQENAGPSAARNRGMREANGEFLAFLDSDDLWEPAYLAESVAALRETKAGFVFSNWKTVRFGGGTISPDGFAERPGLTRLWDGNEDGLREIGADTIREMFLTSSLVTPSGIVLRHGFFDHNWDETSRIGEDRQFMLDGMFRGRFKAACLSRRLWAYRVHDSNLCTDNPDRISVSRGEIHFKESVLEKHAGRIRRDVESRLKAYLADSYLDLGYHLGQAGMAEEAVQALRKSWNLKKRFGTLWTLLKVRLPGRGKSAR